MGYRGLSGAGGRVGNAYDPRQSAGGSSSGSAVAVGAGYVPFAVGSDNCGSLRIPAAYNGAVTLRASYGRFDVRGIFPIGFANGVPGVIARDTTALRAALAVAGNGWRADADGDLDGNLGGKRIEILRRFDHKDPWAPAGPDARELFAQRSHACAKSVRRSSTRCARRLRRAARAGIPQGLRAPGRCSVRDLSRRPARLARRLHLGANSSGVERRGLRGGRCILARAGAAGGRSDRRQSAQRGRRHGPVAPRRAALPGRRPRRGARRRLPRHHLLRCRRRRIAGRSLSHRARCPRPAGRARAPGPPAGRRGAGGDDGGVRARAGRCRPHRVRRGVPNWRAST